MKWTLRVAGGLLAIVVLAVAGLFITYALWMGDRKRELIEGSRIASTPLGDIEYAIVGEGAPRLMIHGSPGGYDQVLVSPRTNPEGFAGIQVIAVSRPGYLRTPLTSGETPAEQADLYAALLDELGIERVIVQAGSGGAPSGLQMAIRHPDRVKALILLVPGLLHPELAELDEAQNGQWDFEWPTDFAQMLQNMFLFAAGDILAKSTIPNLDTADPAQLAGARGLLLSAIPTNPRRSGQENDIIQFARMDLSQWPLENVATPTLLLHGNADRNAPYEGSVEVSARMPNAELVTFEGADHYMVITHAEEIGVQIKRFLVALDQPEEVSIAAPSDPE